MKGVIVQSRQRMRGFVERKQQLFCEYATLCTTSGYIPRAIRLLQRFARFLATIWVFVQIGRVKVLGSENFIYKEPMIYCPNHSSMFDVPIIYSLMHSFPRWMTAREEMMGLHGCKAVVMGSCGSFAVDRRSGKTVIGPAIDVLASGESLVIFPEGRISASGALQAFKPGAAIIALGAVEKLQREGKVGIVPIRIDYNWRDAETALGPYGAMGFKWRGGVTVKVLPPVWVMEGGVQFDAETITAAVRQAIADAGCANSENGANGENGADCAKVKKEKEPLAA